MDTLTYDQERKLRELTDALAPLVDQVRDCRSDDDLEPISANLRYFADQLEAIERRDSRG